MKVSFMDMKQDSTISVIELDNVLSAEIWLTIKISDVEMDVFSNCSLKLIKAVLIRFIL